MRAGAIVLPATLVLAACADRLGASGSGVGGASGATTVAERELPQVATLVSAAAGDGCVCVRWVRGDPADRQLVLYWAEEPARVFEAPGRALEESQESALVEELVNGTGLFFGLARLEQGRDPVPLGPLLRARPAPPIYVDLEAASGSGNSSEDPTPDLVAALFTAFISGGGNVWVASGEADPGSLPLFGNVHLYGGFPKDFDLAERDPGAHITLLRGVPGQGVLATQVGTSPVVVDGLRIDGRGVAQSGVDVNGTSVQLRALDIKDCARGIKLRAGTTVPLTVVIVSCSVRGSELEGLSGEGAFDLRVDASRFEACGQEGVDLDDLIAPDGADARLSVRGSRFAGNLSEGFDVDLDAPSAGGAGGRFAIDLEACDFDGNGLEGLLIDVEFESSPGWTADITVRGCQARANRGPGVRFDLDQRSTALVHRVVGSANGGDGLVVSSESAASMVTISSSAFYANRRAGVRATTGNVPVLLTHCVLSGNSEGGVISDTVRSAAVSCVAYLQPEPWTGVDVYRSIAIGALESAPFVNAPTEYAVVASIAGERINLTSSHSAAAGATVELEDDGVGRTATAVAASALVLDVAPGVYGLPTAVSFFAPGADVAEDFRLTPASAARGVGLSPPFGPPTDAGVFGPPTGGAPGTTATRKSGPFRLGRMSPSWGSPIAADAVLTFTFMGGEPEPGDLFSSVDAVDADGNLLGIITALNDDGKLVMAPPATGWPAGSWVELHSSLRSTEGLPLVPVGIPITRFRPGL